MLSRIRELKRILLGHEAEYGQGMVEYAIIIAVVAVISVVVFSTEGAGGRSWVNSIGGVYDQADNAISQIHLIRDNN
jgi:Flp pilus assembly pilin Flp